MEVNHNLKLINLNCFAKNVILRTDFNVPLKNGIIQSTKRIDAAVPTINFILNQKPNKLFIITHLGRPKQITKSLSLQPVKTYLESRIHKILRLMTIDQILHCKNDPSNIDAVNEDTEIIMLENIRFHPEETNQLPTTNIFRKKLSQLGDIFVNDAFGCMHRAHSSIVGISAKEKYIGFIVEKELIHLNAFNTIKGVKTLILGGSKVSDKIKLIENLIPKVNNILIGGGMVFAFLKYHNIPIGKSLFDEKSLSYIESIYKQANIHDTNIILPVDFKCNSEFTNDGDIITCDATYRVKNSGISEGYMGLDIGAKSINLFKQYLENSNCIVWNGPLGVTEFDNFATGSYEIMKFISDLFATTIIGGGDTACCCEQFNLQDKMTHVSTGGGASLEVFEGKVLPGFRFITS